MSEEVRHFIQYFQSCMLVKPTWINEGPFSIYYGARFQTMKEYLADVASAPSDSIRLKDKNVKSWCWVLYLQALLFMPVIRVQVANYQLHYLCNSL